MVETVFSARLLKVNAACSITCSSAFITVSLQTSCKNAYASTLSSCVLCITLPSTCRDAAQLRHEQPRAEGGSGTYGYLSLLYLSEWCCDFTALPLTGSQTLPRPPTLSGRRPATRAWPTSSSTRRMWPTCWEPSTSEQVGLHSYDVICRRDVIAIYTHNTSRL